MENSKADILISVYGTEHFEQCLKSALKQRIAANVIVCDNTEDEKAQAIVNAHSCARLTYFKPERPLSRHSCCVKLAQMAKAPWVRFLDDCEILTENSLEKRLEQSDAFGGISMTFSSYIKIYPDGKKERITYDLPEYVKGTDYLFNIFTETPFKRFTNILIRRDIVVSELFCGLPEKPDCYPAAAAILAMTEGELVHTAESLVQRYESPQESEKDVDTMIDEADAVMDVMTYVESATEDRKRSSALRKEILSEMFRRNTATLIKQKRYSDAVEYFTDTWQNDRTSVLKGVFHLSILVLAFRAAARNLNRFRRA
jgi:hypothetical protein